MHKAVLIVNPNATRVTSAGRELIGRALASVSSLRVESTKHQGHATSLATEAVHAGTEHVIVLGGDGTVNEVSQALVDSTTTLSVIPGGGTDVFARAMGIPRDPLEAARNLAEALESHTEPKVHHVGLFGEPGAQRVFTFNAGVGFDAEIVKRVESRPKRKSKFGQSYFVWQALRTFFAGYDRKGKLIEIDSDVGSASGVLVVASLRPDYTFLGNKHLKLCPKADSTQGIDLFVLKSMKVLPTLRIALSAFGRARHLKHPSVQVLHATRKALITCETPELTQTDGELGPHATTLELSHGPKLKVLV